MTKFGDLPPAQRAEEDLEDGHGNGECDPEEVDLAQPRLNGREIDPAQRKVKESQRHRHPGYKDQKSAHGRPTSLMFRLIQAGWRQLVQPQFIQPRWRLTSGL